MTGAWAAFATSGDPSLAGEGVLWQQVETSADGGGHTFLNISGPTPAMASSQDIADRMRVWQAVIG